MRRLLLLLPLLCSSPAWAAGDPSAPVAASAPLDTRQLREFRAESEAFNAADPMANVYRAGHYNGYLQGMIDALQGRHICFSACRCDIDALVADHLSRHPAMASQPVATWLLPLLEARYPCRAPPKAEQRP